MKDKLVSIRVNLFQDEYDKLVQDTLNESAKQGKRLSEGDYLREVWLAKNPTKMFKHGQKVGG